jgi:hypothetical protein
LEFDKMSTTTRRDFLTTAPALAAAPIAALAVPAEQPAPPPDSRECDHPDGEHWRELAWTFDTHPWCARFLVGIRIAIDACEEAEQQAPDCYCWACCNLRGVASALSMFESAIESDQYGPSFVENWERKLREEQAEPSGIPGYLALCRQHLKEAKAAGRYAFPPGGKIA